MGLCARCLPVVFLGLGWSSPVHAQSQVVVPNTYTNTDGLGVSSVPIDAQNRSWTFQLICNQSQLTGLIGQEITGIAYRRGATEGGGYPLVTTTWESYIIRVGPSVAPNAATGTFASNFTAAPTEVRSSSLTVPPFAWPNLGPPGPNPWGPVITFDTPFLYTGGDLAIQIAHPGSNNPSIGNALMDTTATASPGRGTDYSYFAGTGFDVSSGVSSVFMPIAQFTAVTPVPEPATSLLTGAALMGLGAALLAQRRDSLAHKDLEPPACLPEHDLAAAWVGDLPEPLITFRHLHGAAVRQAPRCPT